MTLILIFLATTASAVGQCGLCHPDVRVVFEPSVHFRERIGCVDCHGGNPESITVEGAHRQEFRNALTRFEIPELCADCHSDPARMRPYNLSTEQFALYQTSEHGILLAAGDPRVAVCTDCHGVHDIRSPNDPSSKSFQRQVPETCGQCHGDPDLMARYGKDILPFDTYMKSLHADQLLNHGNRNAPDCSRCHGVHGATPPGVGDVDKVCGSCHSTAREAYLTGPHASLEHGSNLPECVTCHGSHKVMMVSRGRIADSCAECHGEASPQFETGSRMDVLFARANEELEKAREKIDQVRRIPLYVDDYEARLQEAETYLLEAEPAVHSVSLPDMQRFAEAARSMGEEVQAEIQGELSDLRLRRVGLIIFWFYLILTIAIILRIRRNTVANQA